MATVVFGGLIAQVLPQPAGVAKLAAAAPLVLGDADEEPPPLWAACADIFNFAA